jgi:uncharacterized membrane protein YhaH (DUF805 family)
MKNSIKNNFEFYTNALKNKYATFSGRATRSEYWYFVLFNFLISIAVGIVSGIFGKEVNDLVSGLYSLAMLVPSLAVSSRRLHDTGRSAWWLLLGLVPVVGWIVLLVFFVTDTTPGDNKYGPNPKGMNAAAPTVPPTQTT